MPKTLSKKIKVEEKDEEYYVEVINIVRGIEQYFGTNTPSIEQIYLYMVKYKLLSSNYGSKLLYFLGRYYNNFIPENFCFWESNDNDTLDTFLFKLLDVAESHSIYTFLALCVAGIGNKDIEILNDCWMTPEKFRFVLPEWIGTIVKRQALFAIKSGSNKLMFERMNKNNYNEYSMNLAKTKVEFKHKYDYDIDEWIKSYHNLAGHKYVIYNGFGNTLQSHTYWNHTIVPRDFHDKYMVDHNPNIIVKVVDEVEPGLYNVRTRKGRTLVLPSYRLTNLLEHRI
jgi:hypothetical protein